MREKIISNGVVHIIPIELRKNLTSDQMALKAWENLTPLARNEWICWINEAKLIETRKRRINRTITEIKNNKKRPCCWAGCIHRRKKKTKYNSN